MCYRAFCLPRFNEHVINVDFHGLAYFLGKRNVHQSLIGETGVLQAEGHNFVEVDAPGCHELGFLLVVRVNEDLIIPGESIHEANQLVFCLCIYYLVNVR